MGLYQGALTMGGLPEGVKQQEAERRAQRSELGGVRAMGADKVLLSLKGAAKKKYGRGRMPL